jgi:predicted nucleotidyltransferase
MMKLPENIRRTLEKLVNQLKCKANVYGVGLFGSWSRGDATPSSDIDLFIMSRVDVNYEYIERVQTGGLFVDLNFIPRKWFKGPIPPEIDQKLYEMQILYDRDWLLTNMKLLMTKSYSSPERVEIRTEAFLLNSDIYLSRATSAFSREDYHSAYVFATVAIENTLGILGEIAMEPFSNSHFIERIERATKRLETHDLLSKYLELSRLNRTDRQRISEKLKLFKAIWEEISITAKESLQKLTPSPSIIRARLNYYLNPAFLQGVLMRTSYLIDSEKTVEATHYLNTIFLDIAENYAWLRSSTNNVRIDHTTLIRSLKNLEEKNPKNYSRMVDLLDLSNIEKPEANEAIMETRKIALRIRKDSKVLIKNHLTKT